MHRFSQPQDDSLDGLFEVKPNDELFPSVRMNLTSTQMSAMPSEVVERRWRELASRWEDKVKVGAELYPKIEARHRDAVFDVVRGALDTQPRERLPHLFTFDLSRSIRAIHLESGNGITEAPKSCYREAVDMLIDAVLSLALVDTGEHDEWFDRETIWLTFAHGWTKVKCPKGYDPVDFAFALAKEHPIELMPVWKDALASIERLTIVASTIWHLQRLHGEEECYLSVERAGQLVGASGPAMAGSRLLAVLAEFGLIIQTKDYVMLSKARRYRFATERDDLYRPPQAFRPVVNEEREEREKPKKEKKPRTPKK